MFVLFQIRCLYSRKEINSNLPCTDYYNSSKASVTMRIKDSIKSKIAQLKLSDQACFCVVL